MQKKILIIDDEEDIRSYFRHLLEDNGFEAVCASDGQEGFDLALSDKPSLVCLDITMPKESGVRCYRNLCDTEETKNIPVIIVTGIAADFKHFIETRKQVPPPAAYFEKPVDKIEFIAKVKELAL